MVLERQGVVRRVHGGAIPVERFGIEPTIRVRSHTMTPEKQRIARAALAELPEEGVVLLDAGTTTIRLAELLPGNPDLTVVTNGPQVAMACVQRPAITVLGLGGQLRRRSHASVGDWTVRLLGELLVDVAFMATNGVSVEHGLTTPHPTEAATKRAMIQAARRVVLLADHTKVGNDCFARFGDLREVDTFITDAGLAEESAREMGAAGVRVIRV
jgi:DeoR family transcriptional regulator, fructose operon transcriptional repressor